MVRKQELVWVTYQVMSQVKKCEYFDPKYVTTIQCVTITNMMLGIIEILVWNIVGGPDL